MYPTFKHMILAHPLPLFLFWLPGAAFLYHFANSANIEPEVQVAAAIFLIVWGGVTLQALPKVWWHIYQKRKSARAGIDPELLRQRRRRWQRWVLALLAVAAFEYALFWLSQHSFEQNPYHYSIALVIVASLSFLLPSVLFYRSTRSGSSYFLLLVASVLGWAGLWQLYEHPEFLRQYPQLYFYLPLTAALCALVPPLVVVVTILLRALTWLRVWGATPITSKEKPFAVTWCLPVPRHSPDAAVITETLPDYCKQLLATGSQQPVLKRAINS